GRAGKGSFAVFHRHREEARAREPGDGEDYDPVRPVVQRRYEEQRPSDPPRQREVDGGRRDALGRDRDQQAAERNGGPERRERIVGGRRGGATLAQQRRPPVAEQRLADAVRDEGRREQPE